MSKAFLMAKNTWEILSQFLKLKMDIQPRNLTLQERNMGLHIPSQLLENRLPYLVTKGLWSQKLCGFGS